MTVSVLIDEVMLNDEYEVLAEDANSDTKEESIVVDDEYFLEIASDIISVGVDIAKLLGEVASVDSSWDTDSPTIGYVELLIELV